MELEDKVMRKIAAPLNFLRNPRFVRGPRVMGKDAAATYASTPPPPPPPPPDEPAGPHPRQV